MAVERGQHAAAILWDLTAFYDSASMLDLIRIGRKLDYPTVELALGAQMHLAPRIRRAGRYVDQEALVCFGGLVAGCSQAVAWSKGITL